MVQTSEVRVDHDVANGLNSTRRYASGGSKYYVIEKSSGFAIYRQDSTGRTYVDTASDLVEALALIKSDSGSSQIKAR